MFIKYPKIKRLGHEDTDGILMGTVTIEEKVDGANASIWMEDGEIKCGSRTRTLGDESFRGFVEYVKNHEGINRYLKENPRNRLYGEWLVRHTIAYNETAYKQFYLFDILVLPDEIIEPEVDPDAKKKDVQENHSREVTRQGLWHSPNVIKAVSDSVGVPTPQVFATLDSPTPEELEEFVGKTELGEKGEGVVIKNGNFINKWGNRICAKIVTQEFKEDNAVTFGGNNKFSETYIEMKMVQEFMTMARIKKIMHKLQPIVDSKLDVEHTGRIIQTAYHDMFEEELWTFVKKHKKIDFGHLQKLACKKAAKIYHDLLNGHVSVAYEKEDTTREEDSTT